MKIKRIIGMLLAVVIILGMSGVSEDKAHAAVPGIPTNLRWEGTTAKWDNSTNAFVYEIEIYKGDVSNYVIKTLVTTNSYDASGIMQYYGSGQYYFRVRAVSDTNDFSGQIKSPTCYEYVAEGDTAVRTLSASITWPITGQTYYTNPQSGDKDKYTVEVPQSISRYCWYKDYVGNFMSAGEEFQDGKEYYVEITFKPKSGYVLMPAGSTAKLNGVTGYCVSVTSSGEMTFRFCMKAMGKVEAFVTRLYYICLDRAPDESGFNDWVSRLKNHSRTGSQVAKGFIFSNEFKNKNYCNECFVKRLYRAFFGREYDEGGLNNWTNKLRTGWKRQQIFNGFVGSTEFKNLCATYGITQGGKMTVPWIETVVPTMTCPDCGAAALPLYDIYYYDDDGSEIYDFPNANGTYMPEKTRFWYSPESADWVLPTPKRKGYTFKAWYGNATHDFVVTYIPNGSGGTRRCYSEWEPVKYSIKFNANGGSGTMTNQTGLKYDNTYNLKANTFTRSGYTFKGWNRKADGSGTSYANKAAIKNLASTNGGLVTLYAQWKKN